MCEGKEYTLLNVWQYEYKPKYVIVGILTRVLHRRDDELEPVRIGPPVVGDVLECHEVAAREQSADLLLGVPA